MSELTQGPNIRINDGAMEIEVSLLDLLGFVEEYSKFCYDRTPKSRVRYVPVRLWNLMKLLHIYMTSDELEPWQKRRVESWLEDFLKDITLSLKIR